jgi:membrane-associated phospholipid phosphatase
VNIIMTENVSNNVNDRRPFLVDSDARETTFGSDDDNNNHEANGDDPAEKKNRKRNNNSSIGMRLFVRRMMSDVSQAAAGLDTTINTKDETSSSTTTTNNYMIRRTLLSTICWVGFALAGWYVPRYILDQKYDDLLSKVPPYQKVNDVIILDFLLNNPVIDPPTIDGYCLKLTSIVLPLLMMIVYTISTLACHNRYNNNHPSRRQGLFSPTLLTVLYFSICELVSAFAMSIGLSEGMTVMIKQWVQRRRPNFYQLCGFSTTALQCTASPPSIVVEAQLSFPSGHSSLVACGMTFMSLYLHRIVSTSMKASGNGLSGNGHDDSSSSSSSSSSSISLAQFFSKTLCPLCYALFVASSRVVDYWHHPSDVVAGLILGSLSSYLTFRFWFPTTSSIFNTDGRSSNSNYDTIRSSNEITDGDEYVQQKHTDMQLVTLGGGKEGLV